MSKSKAQPCTSQRSEVWQIQKATRTKQSFLRSSHRDEPSLEPPETGLTLGISLLISYAKQASPTLCDHLHILLSRLWGEKYENQVRPPRAICHPKHHGGASSSSVCGSVRGWSRSPPQPHLLSLCQKPAVEPYRITAHSLNTSISLSVKWVTVILQGY